jgi:hypothetical protein
LWGDVGVGVAARKVVHLGTGDEVEVHLGGLRAGRAPLARQEDRGGSRRAIKVGPGGRRKSLAPLRQPASS